MPNIYSKNIQDRKKGWEDENLFQIEEIWVLIGVSARISFSPQIDFIN